MSSLSYILVLFSSPFFFEINLCLRLRAALFLVILCHVSLDFATAEGTTSRGSRLLSPFRQRVLYPLSSISTLSSLFSLTLPSSRLPLGRTLSLPQRSLQLHQPGHDLYQKKIFLFREGLTCFRRHRIRPEENLDVQGSYVR